MPHSFNKIWIHAIWVTKHRQPLIQNEVEAKIHNYLRHQFIELGCPVRIINGMSEHLHILFLLNPKKSIAEIIKQVKGATSPLDKRSRSDKRKIFMAGRVCCLFRQRIAIGKSFSIYSIPEKASSKI